jgi:hypothetical protein
MSGAWSVSDRAIRESWPEACVLRCRSQASTTKRMRRGHCAALKTKVGPAVLKGGKTLAKLGQRYEVHPNQGTTLTRRWVEGATGVFVDRATETAPTVDERASCQNRRADAGKGFFLSNVRSKAGLLRVKRRLIGGHALPVRRQARTEPPRVFRRPFWLSYAASSMMSCMA